MEQRTSPLTAVTDHNPYPYYAELVAQRPFYHDEALGMWVATSAEAVMPVLQSTDCRVRPHDEPIPRHLLGTPMVTVFGQLIRMNDRTDRCPIKHAIATTLATIETRQVAQAALNAAQWLTAGWNATASTEAITAFSFRLSTDTIALLMGLPTHDFPAIATWVAAFVRCLAPSSDEKELAAGLEATEKLLTALQATLTDAHTQNRSTLLTILTDEVSPQSDAAPAIITANALGFLMQAYEATAGLIGNTLVALAANEALCRQATADLRIVPELITEVLRQDAPVQNTRRFVAADCAIAGQQLRAGDAILVVLAAANRDPAANSCSATFDLARPIPSNLAFGAGVHACPGAAIAALIAAAGVTQLLTIGIEPARLAAGHRYYPSANVRIPHFNAG